MSEIDLENALSQFYEDESLTDALTDQPAVELLKWGEEQLSTLAATCETEAQFDEQFTALRKLIRNVSEYVAEHQHMEIETQQTTMQKIFSFAENLGLKINNAVEGVIEQQKALADMESVNHLLRLFAPTSDTPPTSDAPTAKPSWFSQMTSGIQQIADHLSSPSDADPSEDVPPADD